MMQKTSRINLSRYSDKKLDVIWLFNHLSTIRVKIREEFQVILHPQFHLPRAGLARLLDRSIEQGRVFLVQLERN